MVKVNLIGFKELQAKIAKAPVELKKEVGAEVQFAAEEFRERAIKDAPADVGFLRGQIIVKKISEMTAEVVSGSKYSAPMEFGTKKKFRPQVGVDASQFKGQPTGGTFKEMIANITNWVHRKGIAGTYSVKTRRRTGNKATVQSQDRQLAFLIARSILNNGVRPHPFFFKQILPVRRDLVRRVINVLKGI